ncbi:hypothetical protein JQC92_13525 [Shewanella sp. 202IG2-18]|uniref:hypothetical protein n=1 Tax=Parashewanella hymeniacidonis TaxID=2807618 RepID=UPI00195FEBD6|nr:hypothetical protein [Parashewanella hymeniacidonis]MBM7073037.1 hypothetical protein [Parashewanella hymeniacidonis]
MSEIDQIVQAAIELQQEGKEPSTALLKVRTQNQFALPALIRGLKSFKSLSPVKYSKWHENKVTESPSQKKSKDDSLETKIKQLEKQVEDLIEQHQQMQHRITQLESEK